MTVLVTGGAGFIGGRLVARLLEDGENVRVLDNFATGSRENLLELTREVEVVEGDVRSYERVHDAVHGCEIVFHQAALPSIQRSIEDPLTTNATNVTGTLNVLLAARDSGVRRVVYASSSSVYGVDAELPRSERMRPRPASPYAVGKLAGEEYCRSFWELYGLETVSLRYFNTFGPGQDPSSQYAAVIPRFLKAFLRGETPVVFGDGEQTRDFTYVDNIVDANVAAACAEGVPGLVLNVASGERLSLNELLDRLRALTGTELVARYAPPRPGEVRHSQADISAARHVLGYTVAVSAAEGLERTLAYLEARLGEPAVAETSV